MGNQPAAFQLHINHKLIPNVSQKVVVSFIYIQRKDGVYFMSTKKLLTLALGRALIVGVVAGCSSSVNIPSDNNTKCGERFYYSRTAWWKCGLLHI